MTFTYVGDLSTDLDKIRFKVQDTVENAGVKPGKGANSNFSDEEINGLQASEGTVNRTVSALYETLAAVWARYVNTQVGARKEELQKVADMYLSLAKQWRKQYGFGDNSTIFETGFTTRVDGYSDDIDFGET